MTDQIEKTIDLKASLQTVWTALTDAAQFGQWFGVRLDGPFVVRQANSGRITYPGYEHVVWRATVAAIEPRSRFAFTWHPYGIDPDVDYSGETPTLVEFLLEEIPAGVRLTVRESGFDKVPEHRRAEAFRMNDRGWTAQMANIRAHVEG